MRFQWLTIIPSLPVLLVYLAGVIATIVLLVRRRGTPALLALIGFGMLFLTTMADIIQGPVLTQIVEGALHDFAVVSAGVGCCCSILDVAAVICLIVALWQAITGGKATVPPPPPGITPTRSEVKKTIETAAPPPPPARSHETQMLAEEPEEAEWTEEIEATAKLGASTEAEENEPPEDATIKIPPSAAPDSPRKTQILGELLEE